MYRRHLKVLSPVRFGGRMVLLVSIGHCLDIKQNPSPSTKNVIHS